MEECFRDPVPLARDYFLCSHAPRMRFGLYVIDRFGNREMIHADPDISSMCPTIYRVRKTPPVVAQTVGPTGSVGDDEERGEFFMADVYAGIEPTVKRGTVKYIRVAEEVRADLERLPNGEYRKDHPNFVDWYATPVDTVSGPFGWPSYVAKSSHGLVPVEEDGSARFYAPAGKVLYFQALDENFNELQRMRSVVQLQPGEKRSCVGCHESRQSAPGNRTRRLAMTRPPRRPDPPSWGAVPFSYENVVQPVLDRNCAECHAKHEARGLDLSGAIGADRVPASYRTLISKGYVHYLDCQYNSGNDKREPLTFGSLKSKLWEILDGGHHDVRLTADDVLRIKTWIDLNCPLWPDYTNRPERPGPPARQISKAN
ncbi:MAG TPA: hypothetical protein VM492_04030, partial [Sumerlaeia bacterium]|nr:hypothetical protein [Sumerlaeia bacterium]